MQQLAVGLPEGSVAGELKSKVVWNNPDHILDVFRENWRLFELDRPQASAILMFVRRGACRPLACRVKCRKDSLEFSCRVKLRINERETLSTV